MPQDRGALIEDLKKRGLRVGAIDVLKSEKFLIVFRATLADFIISREKELLARIRKPLDGVYQQMGHDPYGKTELHWNPLMYHCIEEALAIIDEEGGR